MTALIRAVYSCPWTHGLLIVLVVIGAAVWVACCVRDDGRIGEPAHQHLARKARIGPVP